MTTLRNCSLMLLVGCLVIRLVAWLVEPALPFLFVLAVSLQIASIVVKKT
jgi:hypothetical protein